MVADVLNSHVYPVRKEMLATKQIPISHICSTYESELKYFLFGKTLYEICSRDEDESKGIINDECSTKEDG